jgi:hypothetical protein
MAMANKQSSFRTTISVPGDLKSRMERVKEPVNWSALACRAFENKLAEIAARKETKTMSDVVQRLRASVRSEQGESFNEGYETGKHWAEETGTAAQLKRMETFLKGMKAKSQREWENWFYSQNGHLPWLAVVGVIQDDKNIHPLNGTDFWKTVLGDETSQKPNDPDFLRGFVEGATDLWVKVQPQLSP